jgi:DNA transformation protein and related proteins
MSPASPLLTTVLDLLLGIYCDDLFIATIHDDKLYFKANAQTADEFIARGLPIFSYPKEGGVATQQYYQAPPEVFTNRAAMKQWADKALLSAKQDAARKPRKKATAKRPDVTLKKKARSAK